MAAPQNHTDPPAPTSVPLIAALVAGLLGAMLAAVVAPRLTGSEGTNWLLALAIGVAVAAFTYVLLGRRRATTTRRRGEH